MRSERGTNDRGASSTWVGAIGQEALERIEALATSSKQGARTPDAGLATLTPRQRDVAALVAQGLTNKQIAQQLGISRFTAETHVRNILERLGAASRSRDRHLGDPASRVS